MSAGMKGLEERLRAYSVSDPDESRPGELRVGPMMLRQACDEAADRIATLEAEVVHLKACAVASDEASDEFEKAWEVRGREIDRLWRALSLAKDQAATGADKAGCDGWRAQEMCRQILITLARAALAAGEG